MPLLATSSTLSAVWIPAGAWIPSGMTEWLAVAVSYLLGAVPFGYVIGRLRGVDIRRSGSGNIGATNAGRVLGRPFAYLAFLGDFGKGWVPVFCLAPWLASSTDRIPDLEVLCALAAVAGHVWPVYLGFRGGKAVATTAGALTAVDPMVSLAGGAVWILVAWATRYVGLASIAMTATFPLVLAWKEPDRRTAVVATTLIALLILYRHRANIARMRAGTEPKMGSRRAEAS
jgi:glycerol-3-phosphate acyltransferase PlsY